MYTDCVAAAWLKAERVCACILFPGCLIADVFVSDASHSSRCGLNPQSGRETRHLLRGGKGFPTSLSWFLYELRRHTRWAPARWGVCRNWHWTRPNVAVPLQGKKINTRDFKLLLFWFFFTPLLWRQDAGVFQPADVNQREDERWEESRVALAQLTPAAGGKVIYVSKVRDQVWVMRQLMATVDRNIWDFV